VSLDYVHLARVNQHITQGGFVAQAMVPPSECLIELDGVQVLRSAHVTQDINDKRHCPRSLTCRLHISPEL